MTDDMWCNASSKSLKYLQSKSLRLEELTHWDSRFKNFRFLNKFQTFLNYSISLPSPSYSLTSPLNFVGSDLERPCFVDLSNLHL